MNTKNNPSKFDGHAKANADEPMFTLLGRDPLAASMVGLWALAREAMDSDGSDAEKVDEALGLVQQMDAWCQAMGRQPLSIISAIPDTVLVAEIERRGMRIVGPTPDIAMQAVQSSMISEAGYSEQHATLAVRFTGKGDLYHYADVPREVWDAFINAESCGKFFGLNIRGKFTSTKITETVVEPAAEVQAA